jgi:hypothetical protein
MAYPHAGMAYSHTGIFYPYAVVPHCHNTSS